MMRMITLYGRAEIPAPDRLYPAHTRMARFALPTRLWARANLRITLLTALLAAVLTTALTALLRGPLEAVDERGGGRNSDEGFHISAGVIIGGTIAAGVGAFVAERLGLLSGE